MGPENAKTAELFAEVLRKTRGVLVSVDADGCVASLDCPWGEWTPAGLAAGRDLPLPLAAVLEATQPELADMHFPFIRLDEETVVDVYVRGGNRQRQLVLHDVSEVHRAELKYQQKAYEASLLAERQVELNRQLATQSAELHRANQAKSRFIASMSHEFRTPIASIMGYADRLSRESADKAPATAIRRACWHLLTLVENLLEQARHGEGATPLNPEPIDLDNLLKDMRALFDGQARDKGLELLVTATSDDTGLETDEMRLRQVLVNLLGNAVRYTHEGQVELAVSRENERLVFAVSDSGPGIDAADRQRIFKPFERADSGEHTGAGLGLAITKALVEAMGGQLELDSVLGRGSTFRFSLPLVAESEPVATVVFEGLAVLLVDDDPDTRAIYELFMSDFGLQVHTATGLEEALANIDDNRYDIVITDVHLGDGLGTDLLRAVRVAQPACRTLLCSSSSFPADWHEQHDKLADGFLLKPVQPHHLHAALERLIGDAP